MITEPELAPEQREKMLRSQRLYSVIYIVFGVVSVSLSIIELFKGRHEAYVYVTLALGIAWFFNAWVTWSHAKRFA